jgi:hypothetical protein
MNVDQLRRRARIRVWSAIIIGVICWAFLGALILDYVSRVVVALESARPR